MSKIVEGKIVFKRKEIIQFIASCLDLPESAITEETIIPYTLQVALVYRFSRSLRIQDINNFRVKDVLSQMAIDAA
ncbi:MAG: hypothetical protein A3D39_05525 [Candidatus Buchananbacteria bacterium RIFCSPHIGHO2_02_FULL_39_17]|uniref:Uncharacterized protein n=1 Tax=Candidatus Buchananbacteria bacterium RIFCSPLOWO2_01_FULL_40_23b TaxID=1797544 RepID=A0A1G1YPF6_9BACT|nr:MAG: hypothetical protein A3D39_05525 [Candidatus Buchananbacteria bacterium RIFCSPHIGHO2_02_FULL_39_17]OGY53686.1 MAG: hypothetical protein A2912_05070 [Candidatus Buchananbacteria bacterium RIFCSPLOWO2_01_FULL_40_23b]